MSIAAYLRENQNLLVLPIILLFFLIERRSWRQLKKDLEWNKDKIDNRLSNVLIGLGFCLSFYLRASAEHEPFLRFIKPPEGEAISICSFFSWGFIILGCFLRDWNE
jgi:hypothetical protein